MKIYNIASSTVMIESKKTRVLMDPWFINGEYYGSWHHTHDIDLDIDFINSATHIYVSHIHPDHFSRKSFKMLNKNIPVLIHSYASKFLKFNIEKLGFKTVEIDHDEEYFLDSETKIKIYAADNCNPELCSKFMGCSSVEVKYKTTQIDSLSLIYNNDFSVLNTNDCPFDLASDTIELVQKKYKKQIDLLLVGYAGAGPYPQCFIMPENEKIKAAENKKYQFLDQGVKFIEKVKPKYYMPFAGTYILGGNLNKLNDYRGVPEIDAALRYFKSKIKFSNGFLLNAYENFDIEKNKLSSIFKPLSEKEKKSLNEKISKQKLDYEHQELPNEQEIEKLIPKAFERFIQKKEEINFISNTSLIIKISETKSLLINLTNESFYKFIKDEEIMKIENFVKISLDYRLLYNILRGPRYAHWNNAEIGSHLVFERKPNIFERGLYHALCFFHS
jgi:UDP-MurNAc hydroxylase